MDITSSKILKGVMTAQEIAETHEKLDKLGKEGSNARTIAFDFMRLATLANKFRFHDKVELSDYFASADQFLSTALAVRDTHGLTFDRISSGIEWLKDNGFDYTYGRLDIQALVVDAKVQIGKRKEWEEARKAEQSKPKTSKKTESWQDRAFND